MPRQTRSPYRPRILVVDDQPINIQTLYQIFNSDHKVFMSTSGARALVIAVEQRPELILLDVLMPDMDGYVVCQHLKQNPLTRDIPVIFVTSQNSFEEEARGLQIGAVDFIRKPVNAAVVRARVQTHLDLRRLKAHLEEEVAKRTSELEITLLRLQQSQQQLTSSEAKATLSTLIASVSHELSSPLGNSLLMASSLTDQVRGLGRDVKSGVLKRSDLTNFVTSQIEGNELMLRNLNRALELLTNFRQVAADQASEQRRTFDLATVVREVISSLSPTLKRHAHSIELNVPEGILMDSLPGPLGQIVINLINNAYLHAFEGLHNGTLFIRAEVVGPHVMLQFEDNGVGISPEHLAKLFDPFFSTKIGKGGTGLGMAIVANLVKKTLKGEVNVQSSPGFGTRFDILIPQILSGAAK